MEEFRYIMGLAGTVIDAAGVIIIVAGAIIATAKYLFRRSPVEGLPYKIYRQDLGKAIILGLEFLVAGDIIRTVVVSPNLTNVIVLAIIVLIRTVLSMTLQLEVDGCWPWQKKKTAE